MAVSPKTAGVAATVIGGSAATGVGIHQLTKEPSDKTTLGEKVKDYAIEKSGSFDYRITNKGNKALPESVTDSNSLKTGCTNKYETLIGSLSDTELKKLVNLVNEGCTFTIRQKLNEDILKTDTKNSNSDADSGKVKAKYLKAFDETDNERIFDFSALKKVHESIANVDNDWDKLTTGCKTSYESSFLGEEDNLGKLASKFCTKPKIMDELLGNQLPPDNELNEEGSKKITEGAKQTNGAKDTNLKTKLTTGTDESKRKELKDGCKNQYKKPKDSKVNNNESLLEEVKKLCVLTIKDKIETSKQLSVDESKEDNKTDGEGRENSLQTDTNHSSLPSDLQTIKTTTKTTDSWKKLRTGCKETYEKGYKGENQTLGKLAKDFCQKP